MIQVRENLELAIVGRGQKLAEDSGYVKLKWRHYDKKLLQYVLVCFVVSAVDVKQKMKEVQKLLILKN